MINWLKSLYTKDQEWLKLYHSWKVIGAKVKSSRSTKKVSHIIVFVENGLGQRAIRCVEVSSGDRLDGIQAPIPSSLYSLFISGKPVEVLNMMGHQFVDYGTSEREYVPYITEYQLLEPYLDAKDIRP
jgi:hypothetical protein